MPSPFPGMDPFLEAPGFFPGLHQRLITGISNWLQERLPEPFYAELGERIWVDISERLVEPDVDVFRRNDNGTRSSQESAVATLAVRTPPLVVHVPHDENREVSVEIYSRFKEEKLVTSIEVLSRSNKTPGSQGRELYLKKQAEMLAGKVNLVEIDLLRGGAHTTCVPHDRLNDRAGSYDYHVCVHDASQWEDYFVYPFRLQNPLPEIAIPLQPDLAPVSIDLQLILNDVYDAGPYRRRLRYGERSPIPPLRPDQMEWAAAVLREKGLIPPSTTP